MDGIKASVVKQYNLSKKDSRKSLFQRKYDRIQKHAAIYLEEKSMHSLSEFVVIS